MQKYSTEFQTYLQFRIFVLHKFFFFLKGNGLHFPKFRNDIHRTTGDFFFFFYQCGWNSDSGYSFYQSDQVVSTWSLHCTRLRTRLHVEDSKGPTNVIRSKMLIFSYLPVIPIGCF